MSGRPSHRDGNPLRSRADLQLAVRALWEPVARRLSPGGARACLGHTGALCSPAAAELEGFCRPLWGLAPLAAGGGVVDWGPHRRGLASGSDPAHPEYWGRAEDNDQRLVEMAAIALAVCLIPEQLWDPLEDRVKQNLALWLRRCNEVAMPDSNWLFFRVLINEALASVGHPGFDARAQAAALDRLESFYLGGGWYSDGPTMRRDHYVGFAMHLYGLLYARLAGARDPGRAGRFRERAALFAQDFAHWFATDGSALPFGRSLTYRFAQGAFWGALAFADVEALPWGEIKGLALRHLRWWLQWPITDERGVLTIGYTYPNLLMSDEYNSPGSPYWALKAFLPLALPEGHPFWQAEEAACHRLDPVRAMAHAGMVVYRDRPAGHVVALSSGQHAARLRQGPQKYAKFAYSTAFGFSVCSGDVGLPHGAHDSMLALSDDDRHWRVREEPEEARLSADGLYSRWRPWSDVEVETWLVACPPWHVRLHRLRTPRTLWSAEGGFAVERGGDPGAGRGAGRQAAGPAHACVVSARGCSGLRDLNGQREGTLINTSPNTNLLFARALLPTLRQQHQAGEHWLACAVLATTSPQTWGRAWTAPPDLRSVQSVL